ncbi:MAG TPA: sigma-70 family RNA polymerase sigma factor [Actinomycetota bacterium]|nr:sigma-70 family RNA polymerase sigma factor [Actinomycetota bacterium]
MADERSDPDLLAATIRGDNAAFDTLVARHEDRIFSLAVRMLGDRADALDATQDAFISAFRRARSFKGDSAVGTWLYRIAINSCKDLIRKRSRWDARDRAAVAPSEDVPDVGDAVIARLDLRAALEALPDEYREAVVLHDLGGVPYEEIAAVAGVPVGTVKSRISRGRRQLARLLEQPARSEASKG